MTKPLKLEDALAALAIRWAAEAGHLTATNQGYCGALRKCAEELKDTIAAYPPKKEKP
jgi:hypothetical protein